MEESEDEGVWQTNRRGQPFIARTKMTHGTVFNYSAVVRKRLGA